MNKVTICNELHCGTGASQNEIKLYKRPFPMFKKTWETFRGALDIYSNVHRGSGIYSVLSTALLEKARKNILGNVCSANDEYNAIFLGSKQSAINSIGFNLTKKPFRIIHNLDTDEYSRFGFARTSIILQKSSSGFIKIDQIIDDVRSGIYKCDDMFILKMEDNDFRSLQKIYSLLNVLSEHHIQNVLIPDHRSVAKIDLISCGIDHLIISGDAVGAPFNIVALVSKKGLLLNAKPFEIGGGMVSELYENKVKFIMGVEAGTPNTLGAVALLQALSLIKKNNRRLCDYREMLISNAARTLSNLAGDCRVSRNGEIFAVRLPSSVCAVDMGVFLREHNTFVDINSNNELLIYLQVDNVPNDVERLCEMIAYYLKRSQNNNDIQLSKTCSESNFADTFLQTDDLSNFYGETLRAKLAKIVCKTEDVPTVNGNKAYINFDNAASTPAFLPTITIIEKYLHLNKWQKEIVFDKAREIIKTYFHVNKKTHHIIYGRNITEAINLFARNLNMCDGVIINTDAEHNSNELPWRYVENAEHKRILANNNGLLDLWQLEYELKELQCNDEQHKRKILVAISGASNVLGGVNDIYRIAQIVHRYGGQIFVDGAQSSAHQNIYLNGVEDIPDSQIDYYAFSGHKMYSPFGIGGLIVRNESKSLFIPDLEEGVNIDLENKMSVVALAKSINLLDRIGLNVIVKHEKHLLDYALNKLEAIKGIVLYGAKADTNSKVIMDNSIGIIPFNIAMQSSKGIGNLSTSLVASVLSDEGGIGVREGCFCANLLVRRLRSAQEIRNSKNIFNPADQFFAYKRGVDDSPEGMLRISFGLYNTVQEIDKTIDILRKLIEGCFFNTYARNSEGYWHSVLFDHVCSNYCAFIIGKILE